MFWFASLLLSLYGFRKDSSWTGVGMGTDWGVSRVRRVGRPSRVPDTLKVRRSKPEDWRRGEQEVVDWEVVPSVLP